VSTTEKIVVASADADGEEQDCGERERELPADRAQAASTAVLLAECPGYPARSERSARTIATVTVVATDKVRRS
jgi:hypothetical protein